MRLQTMFISSAASYDLCQPTAFSFMAVYAKIPALGAPSWFGIIHSMWNEERVVQDMKVMRDSRDASGNHTQAKEAHMVSYHAQHIAT
ncbi:Hypothetical predicted protein [Prunus dulcis]|uniref:Uncharacterized protein n=1 Tax=Prunus dulcis TaxID=3755 RepID=A0A5E4G7Z2_PRUDU|nr:hypothetical protein L3X38_003176 [Prunus dulcis]VVA35889.1 Hypothetical predicted protein [Prunus dulcis]